MKMQKINVCFSCNDKYFPHMLVAITSILDNIDKKRSLQIHILTNGLSKRNIRILDGLKSKNNFLYNIVLVSVNDFLNCPITGYVNYITRETYYRFKIPSFLNNVDKVLYLDCDIVVLDDISKLYDYNFADGKHIGMVRDTNIHFHRSRLGLGGKSHYCNAGVMLIDNKFLREINAEDMFFKFAKSPSREITFQDQDIINIVLEEYIELLPFSWNLMHDSLLKTDAYEGELKDSLEKAKQNPSIVHFTSPKKPWNFGCKNPYAKTYLHYLKKLPFRTQVLKLYMFRIIEKLKKSSFTKNIKDMSKLLEYSG